MVGDYHSDELVDTTVTHFLFMEKTTWLKIVVVDLIALLDESTCKEQLASPLLWLYMWNQNDV
jgi:hypothetical protein